MKISRLFNSLPKKLAAGALVALAVALPVSTLAASNVKLSATTGVANVTAGDTTYSPSVNAKYNEVIKVEVTYDNTEAPGSGKVAKNLHVKVNVPTKAGVAQTITSATSADNADTVNGSVKVNLDGQDAYLQYIPGTAEWKHASTANGPMVVEQKISDDVVMNANGINLGDENPCQAGAVAVEVGVMVPGVSVDKYVRATDNDNWTTSINAKAGDTVEYAIAYHNTGNTAENDVIVRDNLPPNMTLVSGSSYIKNDTHPDWTALNDDDVTGNGIVIGTYNPGAAGYVMFSVKVPSEDKLQCGANQFRNVGIVQPKGMNEYYNTADVNVTKQCNETPTYSCDAFHVTVGDNRTVKVDTFKFTASDNSSLGTVTLNWGDNNPALTTDNVVGQQHQYAADGTYAISLSNFKVGGKTVDVSGNCTQEVSFTTPGTPPTTPPTTPPELPNTGAGNVIGLVAAAMAAGTIGYRLFLSRKLARR